MKYKHIRSEIFCYIYQIDFIKIICLLQIEFDGQSGRVIFDDNGLRKDFKLPLYETRMNLRVSKVCTCIYDSKRYK
jgi:hypothetical protein